MIQKSLTNFSKLAILAGISLSAFQVSALSLGENLARISSAAPNEINWVLAQAISDQPGNLTEFSTAARQNGLSCGLGSVAGQLEKLAASNNLTGIQEAVNNNCQQQFLNNNVEVLQAAPAQGVPIQVVPVPVAGAPIAGAPVIGGGGALLGLAGIGALAAAVGGGGGDDSPAPAPVPPAPVDPDNDGICTAPTKVGGQWTDFDRDCNARNLPIVAAGNGGDEASFQNDEYHEMGYDAAEAALYKDADHAGTGSWKTSPLDAINASFAYSLGWTGAGQTIAIVDSGVDFANSDLSGKSKGSHDAFAPSANAESNHGTHVAGIAAAKRNGSGMHGVAYDADLYDIKIFKGAGGAINFTELANGVDNAVAAGARVFNNSWGSLSGTIPPIASVPTLETAIQNAINAGSVFVWAAGNDNDDVIANDWARLGTTNPNLAQHWVNVVNVGEFNPINADEFDYVLSDSNGGVDGDADFSILGDNGYAIPVNAGAGGGAYIYHHASNICGDTKDYCLAAPGSFMESTVFGSGGIGTGTGYSHQGGTSMAAPMVSGALAVLMQAFPYMPTEAIVDLMLSTARDLGDAGVDEIYGHGLLDLEAALTFVGDEPTFAITSSVTGTTAVASGSAVNSNASVSMSFGNALEGIVVTDDFGRAFNLDPQTLVTAMKRKEKLTQLAERQSKSETWQVAENVQVSFSNASNDTSDDLNYETYSISYNSRDVTVSAGLKDTSALNFNSIGSDPVLGEFSLMASGLNEWVKPDLSLSVAQKIGNESFVSVSALQFGDQDASIAGSGLMVDLGTKVGNTSLSLKGSLLSENDTVFGIETTGAFALAEQTQITALGLAMETPLNDKISFVGQAEFMKADVTQAAQNSLVTSVDRLQGVGFAVGLSSKDVLSTNDRLSVSVGQPFQITHGQANLTIPVGRDVGGVVLQSDRTVDLTASQTPYAAEISYMRKTGDFQSLEFGAQVGQNSSGEAYQEAVVKFGIKF
ncbi:MAG: S8 family peptidase [Alphaproteobacteria bacterium]